MDMGMIYALAGAALAVFLAGTGSSIGIGYAGSAANGVLSEEPDKFGIMLLLVALPGTQGIYGFLTGFMVLMKVGILGGTGGDRDCFPGVADSHRMPSHSGIRALFGYTSGQGLCGRHCRCVKTP